MKRNRLIAFILALILTLGLSVPAMAARSDFETEKDKHNNTVLKKYTGNGGDVVIPDDIDIIGSGAFKDCTNLTSVTIPASVSEMSLFSFENCTSLTDIYYAGTKEQWVNLSGCKVSSEMRKPKVHCSDGIYKLSADMGDFAGNRFKIVEGVLTEASSYYGYIGDISIPVGVLEIPGGFFSSQDTLTSIVIPDTVTDIGDSTFSWCENLTSVRLPSGITRIGNGVFFGCKSLTSVNIPSGVTEIEAYAFGSCDSLESVTIPSSVTEIGDSSFAYCGSLKSITIPSGVTKIGDSAFSGCGSLTEVTIPSGVTKLGGIMFTFSSNLKSITIPASVTEITDFAFFGCDRLTDIYFGGTKEQWEAIRITKYEDEADIFEGYKAEYSPLFTATVHFSNGSSKPGTSTGQQDNPAAAVFTDVPDGMWFTEPVKWAVGEEITNGTTATTFSPYDTCTNAHILTFLWRANGSPEAAAENTFTDVPDTAYYCKAALWAKSLGMISGTTMSPDAPCTRASTVMFMWKAAGSPSVNTKTGFTDVPADADYAMAVAWAFENKVTTGASATTFNPNGTCTRAEIVTFLYRAKDI